MAVEQHNETIQGFNPLPKAIRGRKTKRAIPRVSTKIVTHNRRAAQAAGSRTYIGNPCDTHPELIGTLNIFNIIIDIVVVVGQCRRQGQRFKEESRNVLGI
jgi:hypothetical protein